MSETTPLTITFEIAAGDVWMDPEGVAWYVRIADGLGAGVQLERTVTTNVDPRTLVRTWRKMGDPHDPKPDVEGPSE